MDRDEFLDQSVRILQNLQLEERTSTAFDLDDEMPF
jgi:hypothetical protein